eukprot:scaffold17881_cov148-Skeletonema_dohrnii-CCMP3373.AAC.4
MTKSFFIVVCGAALVAVHVWRVMTLPILFLEQSKILSLLELKGGNQLGVPAMERMNFHVAKKIFNSTLMSTRAKVLACNTLLLQSNRTIISDKAILH